MMAMAHKWDGATQIIIDFGIDTAASSFMYYFGNIAPLLWFQVMALLKTCRGKNDQVGSLLP